MDKSTLPRDVMQMLVEKLDRNLVTPSSAKEHALKVYGVAIDGRTKARVIRSLIENTKQGR